MLQFFILITKIFITLFRGLMVPEEMKNLGFQDDEIKRIDDK